MLGGFALKTACVFPFCHLSVAKALLEGGQREEKQTIEQENAIWKVYIEHFFRDLSLDL